MMLPRFRRFSSEELLLMASGLCEIGRGEEERDDSPHIQLMEEIGIELAFKQGYICVDE